jgi:hypothetical protein
MPVSFTTRVRVATGGAAAAAAAVVLGGEVDGGECRGGDLVQV